MLVVFPPLRYQLTIHLSRNTLSMTITTIISGLALAVYSLQVSKYAITMPTINIMKRSRLINSPNSQVSIWWILLIPTDNDINIYKIITAVTDAMQ